MLEAHLYLAMRSKLLLAQGVVDPSECIVLVLKHGPTTYMFVHFGIMDPHGEFSTSAVPRIPGYPYPTPISYQLLWAVTCLPPSIITPYTKGLLCYRWLSFCSCESSLHRVFIWFYWFYFILLIVCFCFFLWVVSSCIFICLLLLMDVFHP
jgi:hypothetical protein